MTECTFEIINTQWKSIFILIIWFVYDEYSETDVGLIYRGDVFKRYILQSHNIQFHMMRTRILSLHNNFYLVHEADPPPPPPYNQLLEADKNKS